MSQVIPSCTVFYYPENTPPRSLTLSSNPFHIYLILFPFIFSVFYHTRILPSFSIVLLFASESFFVFFFQFTYQFPLLSVPFCSFPSRNFLYFFCVIHRSITAMQWRIQDFPNGGALFCHKWGGAHPVFR